MGPLGNTFFPVPRKLYLCPFSVVAGLACRKISMSRHEHTQPGGPLCLLRKEDSCLSPERSVFPVSSSPIFGDNATATSPLCVLQD